MTGNVVREGQPIDDGRIQFTPAGGGPAAQTMIKGGKYQFTKETGPVEGAQVVTIQQSPLKAEVPPGTPKKDAETLPDTRFKKPMPPNGWALETTIAKGQDVTRPVDFDVDQAKPATGAPTR